MAPSQQQRDLAGSLGVRARWNDFGTPAVLASTGAALAEGLPTDPVAGARAYVVRNRELLGLTARAAGALEVVTVVPIGAGAAVLLRQRFGDLAARIDGLVTIGLRDGKVFHVSSSLARDVSAPAPATLSAQDAARGAARDAGLEVRAVRSVDPVAVPTPLGGPRAAYQVVLIAGGAEPVAFSPSWTPGTAASSSARTWSTTRSTTRRGRCSRTRRGSTIPPRTRGSPGAWGRSLVGARRWWARRRRRWLGKETATPSPTRDYRYAWTNQWFQEKCSPAVFDTAQRNDIDAARANLFAMHNRMHDWSYHLGFTEAAFNLQGDNFKRGGKQNDRSRARPGRRRHRWAADLRRARQRQPDHPTRRPPTDHQHVPLAIHRRQLLRPCVDGDYDMSVIGRRRAAVRRPLPGPRGASGRHRPRHLAR